MKIPSTNHPMRGPRLISFHHPLSPISLSFHVVLSENMGQFIIINFAHRGCIACHRRYRWKGVGNSGRLSYMREDVGRGLAQITTGWRGGTGSTLTNSHPKIRGACTHLWVCTNGFFQSWLKFSLARFKHEVSPQPRRAKNGIPYL
jgi:hypothetical protein